MFKSSKRQASDLIVDFDEEKAISGKKWAEGGIPMIVSSGSLKKALNELESKMLHLKYHCYVKKIQEDNFEASKNNIDEKAPIPMLLCKSTLQKTIH